METHLAQLEHHLIQRGWHLVEILPGDDYRISATWSVQRGPRRLLIDFEGLDDLETLPVEASYGCHVREAPSVDLYFPRTGTKVRQARWRRELQAFVAALDDL